MKKAQIAVIGVALSAGVGAYLLMPGPPEQPKEIVRPAPTVEYDDVLVAAVNLDYGTTLNETSVKWQQWPKDSPIQGVVRQKSSPAAIEELKGWVVRGQIMADEPIRRERLVKGPTAGLMSTLVSPGRRAVAINIDASGSTSAGGFILPNDRVDVLRTARDEDAARSGQGESFLTQTILSNVKVLAIGQNVQTENGKSVVVGTNATLELDPRQTEAIILAQRTGQLSLSLRSMTDAIQNQVTADEGIDDKAMTIVRYGVPSTLRSK